MEARNTSLPISRTLYITTAACMLAGAFCIALAYYGARKVVDTRRRVRTVAAHTVAASHLGGPIATSWLLRLGLEQPGVQIYIVTQPVGDTSMSSIKVLAKFHDHSEEICQLNDLRGLVRVRSDKDALSFVRLGTTLPTWGLVASERGDGSMEIDTTEDLPELPTFGVGTPITRRRAAAWPYLGQHGIVSPKDFQVGGFQRPRVRSVNAGFIVTRWMLFHQGDRKAIHPAVSAKEQRIWRMVLPDFSDGYLVGLVEERVGSDGSYQRRVLAMKPAPRLPRTEWQPLGRNI